MLIDSPFDQMHGNFSLDGRFVANSSNESGRFEVYVETVPRSNTKLPVSTSGGYEPRWRGDGAGIYYLSEDRKLMGGPSRLRTIIRPSQTTCCFIAGLYWPTRPSAAPAPGAVVRSLSIRAQTVGGRLSRPSPSGTRA